MEFDLSGAISSLTGRSCELVRELDSVMEFGLKYARRHIQGT